MSVSEALASREAPKSSISCSSCSGVFSAVPLSKVAASKLAVPVLPSESRSMPPSSFNSNATKGTSSLAIPVILMPDDSVFCQTLGGVISIDSP